MRTFSLLLSLIVFSQAHADNSRTLSRDEIEKKLNDPKILSEAHSGKGFKAVEVRPGSVYEELGVQAGDVIVSANGKPVESIEDAQALYANASVEEMHVKRNGKTVRLRKKPK